MKKLLQQTVPLLAHFEHATVVVVGADYVLAHLASVVLVASTAIIFVVFQLVKGWTE